MVEYKVTGKNKMECAKDYVENHLGEEIKYLNNGEIGEGCDAHDFHYNNNGKTEIHHIWKCKDVFGFYYFSINEIANGMYHRSHLK